MYICIRIRQVTSARFVRCLLYRIFEIPYQDFNEIQIEIFHFSEICSLLVYQDLDFSVDMTFRQSTLNLSEQLLNISFASIHISFANCKSVRKISER